MKKPVKKTVKKTAKNTPAKKKYTVNVHFDAIATVTVEAKDEDEALRLAEEEAEMVDATDFDFNDITGSCVTNVED
jgi:hypothetical protein